jgi:hypothetical protein
MIQCTGQGHHLNNRGNKFYRSTEDAFEKISKSVDAILKAKCEKDKTTGESAKEKGRKKKR